MTKMKVFCFSLFLLVYSAAEGQSGSRTRSLYPNSDYLPEPVTAVDHIPARTEKSGITQDFESFADFTLDFSPWQTLDLDSADTYAFEDITFPNAYQPMAFMVFNPASTQPSMANDEALQPHTGSRFAACFSSVPPKTNNDWLISPPIELGNYSMLSLWVKSYTQLYGLEKYRVLVSTAGNDPADFTVISGASPLQAPVDAWENKQFDLESYNNQTVYIAIQCVSEDAFVFMLDDISVVTDLSGLIIPTGLTADLEESDGTVTLNWSFEGQGTGQWIPVKGSWNQNDQDFDVTSELAKWSSIYFDQQIASCIISADVAKLTGEGAKGVGFYLNGNPQQPFTNGFWKSGYLFLIGSLDDWQYYSFGKQIDNEFVYLTGWVFNEIIQPGWGTSNHLQIAVDNGLFEFRINDSLVATVFDTMYMSGYCGLAMYDDGASGTAAFNNTVIEDLPESRAFNYFRVYRNGMAVGETAAKSYIDHLSQSGLYDYHVTAVYDEGESFPSNTVQIGWNLGIEEDKAGLPVIFPNPVKDFLFVSVGGLPVNGYQLYDLSGRLLLQGRPERGDFRLDVSGFPQGIYFLMLQTGERRLAYKVILERSK